MGMARPLRSADRCSNRRVVGNVRLGQAVSDAAPNRTKNQLKRVANAVEWLLPFISYEIRRRDLQARMRGADPPAPANVVSSYSTLPAKDLERRLHEEHERA